MHVEAFRAHLADPAFFASGIGAAARNDGIALGAQSVANRRTDAAHSSGYVRNSLLLGRHDRPFGCAIAATRIPPAHPRGRGSLLLGCQRSAAAHFVLRNVRRAIAATTATMSLDARWPY